MKEAVVILSLFFAALIASCAQSDKLTTITLDENGCTDTGPTEVSAGDNSFLVRNLTDQYPALYVGRLLNGHTFQDVVDRQGTPGRDVSKPDWTERINGNLVARPTGLPEDVRHYSFTLEEGDHFLFFYIVHPAALWFCSPLTVTAPVSE